MSASNNHKNNQAPINVNESEHLALLNTTDASTSPNVATIPFINRTMTESNILHPSANIEEVRREQLLRTGMDTSNARMALLLHLESTRNAQLQAQVSTSLQNTYDDHNPILNDYSSNLVQQYLLQRRRQQQQDEHNLQQLVLARRLQQLQHQTSDINTIRNQLYGVPTANSYYSMDPYDSLATLPRSQLQQLQNDEGNLLASLLANQTSGISSIAMPQSICSASNFTSVNPRSELLSDPDLIYMQRNLNRPANTEFQGMHTIDERLRAELPINDKSATTNKNDVEDPTPVRALSAYNFFFRYERERILNSNGDEDDSGADISKLSQEALLKAHWSRDRTVKRQHRKSHGKISFADLSKKISRRWRQLSVEDKKFFSEVASKDWERYHRELENQKGDEKRSANR